MAILKPMLQVFSAIGMDPTGRKIMNQLFSYIPTATNALGRNDLVTFYRIMNETQQQFALLPPHITSPPLRKVALERINGYTAINTCVHQGKCNVMNYIRFLFDSINPAKALITLFQ